MGRRSLRYLFKCIIPALLLTMCSKYQSFQDGGFSEKIAASQRWAVTLPYRSGQELVIEHASATEVLLWESQKKFHLTKISLSADRRPGAPMHLELDHGNFCEEFDSRRLLVVGDHKNRKYVTLVDRVNLTPQFSTNFLFEASYHGRPKIISLPGRIRVEDKLVFYQSKVEIQRHEWSDANYRYSVPYVASLKYDIHILDPTKRTTHSFTGLNCGAIEVLRERLADGKLQAEMQRFRTFPFSKRSQELDRCIYSLDQFFLLDQGKTLVFCLVNSEEERLYYSIDLLQGDRSLQWRRADDLAAKYPHQLVLTKRNPTKKLKSRDLIVSGRTYIAKQFAFLSGCLVVVAREKWAEDRYAPTCSVFGIRFLEGKTAHLDRSWGYTLMHEYDIGGVIEDPISGAIFFPEQRGDGLFKVVGLSAKDGRQLKGFPANFKLDGWGEGAKRRIRIVGTTIDAERRQLYTHDRDSNRIVCADLQRIRQ